MAIIPNMKLIEAKTVSVAVSSVSFTTIPQTYTDLKILISGRNSYTSTGIEVTFNSTSSGYNSRRLYGSGTGNMATDTFGTNYVSNTSITDSSQTALIFGNGEIYIPNYANTSINKIVSIDGTSENNATASYYMFTNSIWSNTSAINTVTIKADTGNLEVGTKVYLYGISSSAVSGTKATGGVIYSDATYFYHAFPTSGTFTPTQSISCDYIIIGGGGGGGGIVGGGGGAGQVASYTSQSLSATGYAVTIGGGGTSPAIATLGTNGTSTTFASNTAIGGGGGGAYNGQNGANGASGGGGGGSEPANANAAGGTGTAGFNGGAGTGFGIGATYAGGGGGGAGGVGANAVQPSGGVDSSSIAGNGGIGATSSLINAISLTTGYGQYNAGNYYIAAGGGGASGNALTNIGFGGIGGGGNGGANEPGTRGTNGLVNTGSGGGGARDNLGGNGAAGLVVIRYAK